MAFLRGNLLVSFLNKNSSGKGHLSLNDLIMSD
jgi:hypothetical protein